MIDLGIDGFDYTTIELEKSSYRLGVAGNGPAVLLLHGFPQYHRVAYRMALDHPGRVERLAVLNIVPTVDQFDRMGEGVSIDYYPWYLLAQPPPFAERLIGASAVYFVRHTMESWAADPQAIDEADVDR
jgi:haloacetate dehalogenase